MFVLLLNCFQSFDLRLSRLSNITISVVDGMYMYIFTFLVNLLKCSINNYWNVM